MPNSKVQRRPSYREDLSQLMRPSSVAIIGASEDPARIGGRPLRYLRDAGFAGRVYPVNPTRDTVQGIPCYPDIDAVPEAVDVAILAVPAAQVVAIAQACANRKTANLIIFSADFAESGADGVARQEALAEIGRRSGMRILGPNCLGVFNAIDGFYGTFTQAFDGGFPQPGAVGVVSQSGAYGGHLAHLCRQRQIGITHWITTGNECDVNLTDALAWMVQSPEVEVILVYAETVRDGPGFIEALQEARRRHKPVIMIKVGRSEAGTRAAASHTGALAGKDAVYDAVFRQFGVLRARTTEQMIDTALACLQKRFPQGKKIGVLSMSGGIGIQMADAAEFLGLDVAPLPESGQAEIKRLIPYAGTANPIDMTAGVLNDPSHVLRCIEIAIEFGRYDAIMMFIGTGVAASNLRGPILSALQDVRKRFPDQLIALALAGPEEITDPYRTLGFVVCEDVDRGLQAIYGLMHFGQSFRSTRSWPGLPEAKVIGAIPRDEYGAKKLLAAHGIPCLSERVATTVEDVESTAVAVGGAVVVKVLSPDIGHKTEVGGVAVNLRSPAEAAKAAAEIRDRVRQHRPDARIEGYLVAPMCRGIEVICGALIDPTFGPMVMVGLGGVHAELLNDVAFRLAPFTEEDAHLMLNDLKMRSLFDGLRGAPPSDVDSLATALSNLSEFIATARNEVAEIDINPFVLLPRGQGGVALDALIVPRTNEAQTP